MYLIRGICTELRETGRRSSSVGALPRHVGLLPHVDADADQQERQLCLDQDSRHFAIAKEDIVGPL